MKFEMKSFHTKVARRIFFLFIICAILPVSVFAAISFIHVKKQLLDQCNENLRRESKSLAISFYERLMLLNSEMRFLAANYGDSRNAADIRIPDKTLKERFTALALIHNNEVHNIYGEAHSPADISEDAQKHLLSGKALIYNNITDKALPELYMCVSLNSKTGNSILTGKINGSYLLEASERKPPLTELYVIDQANISLFNSKPGGINLKDQKFQSATGQFEWKFGNREYIASYSSIFLKPNYYYPEWIIILSELKSDALAPMTNFSLTFPVVIVFTLGLVFFLSMSLIRKNMEPIEILKNAAKKISEGSFGHRVEIKSGDEFEYLGEDFNIMSCRLKEGKELLINAAKMSTMGQMAAGIIHEIKQPLSAIYGHLQLAMLPASDENEKRESLNTALKAVSRLNSILDRFRSFSAPSKENMDVMSLNESVRQIHELLNHELLMKNIDCSIELEKDIPPIYGDRLGLQQVISNLVINAIQALEEKPDGSRRIIISSFLNEEKVSLTIEDNGCGIPADLQKRIFDPFFTTKTPDKGTGLGMPIVQSILHRHRAAIEIRSEENTGTIFTITFPIFQNREQL